MELDIQASNFNKVFEQLKKEGMSDELYLKISEGFEKLLVFPNEYILELLSYFVEYKGKPIYVNEIKNYLLLHSNSLFLKYGENFKKYRGVKDVFGLQEPKDVIIASFKEEQVQEPEKIKEYGDKKIKQRKNRTTKMQAKEESIKKFKEKIERRKEREARNEEIHRLIRKQDL